MVARYTGKVFAVILPGKGRHYSYQVAEQFSKKILLLNEQTGQNAMKALTVSCGIASGSCTKDGFEEVMQQADEALYYAKQAGKNQIKVYKKGQTPSHLTDVTVSYTHLDVYKRQGQYRQLTKREFQKMKEVQKKYF